MAPLPKSFISDASLPKAPAGAPAGFVPDTTPVAFRYQVPDAKKPVVSRETKIAGYAADAAAAKKEADYANSPLGFAANFGKDLVGRVAGSEVGLGKTIGKIIAGPPNVDGFNSLSGQQTQLIKMIREKTAKGEDTSKLRAIFNSNADLLDEHKKSIEDYNASLPTTGQAVGQLAGTALDLLSAGTYGKGAAGLKTGVLGKASIPSAVKVVTPLGEKTGLFSLKGAGRVLQGGALGYASDVTQGLQGNRGEDRSGGAAFIPGAGTAIGAAIPAALELDKTIHNVAPKVKGAIDSVLTPEGRQQALIDSRRKELDKLDSLKSLKATTEKGNSRGIDIKKVLSETDVLHGSVDNTGTISTTGKDGAVAQYTKQYVDGNEALVSEALKKEGRSISPRVVEDKLKSALENSGIQGADLVNAEAKLQKELQGYGIKANSNSSIPLETLHQAKIDKYSNINYFTEGASKKYDKTIAKALKELVQENTTSIKVEEVNKELAKHFAVIDYLEKLDGKKVDGGKLGKYFAKTVGAIVGGHIGGPVGAAGGAEIAGRMKGNALQSTFGGKTGIEYQQGPAITGARATVDAPPLQLPAPGSKVIQLPAASTPAPMHVFGNANDFAGVNPGEIINDKIVPVTDTIARHLTEAHNVINGLPPEEINRLGGIHALLDRTKINIVDGLAAEGKAEAANAIKQIDVTGFNSLEQFAAALSQLFK